MRRLAMGSMLGCCLALAFLLLSPLTAAATGQGPATPDLTAAEVTLSDLETELFNPQLQPRLGCRWKCFCTSPTFQLPAASCWGCGSDCASATAAGHSDCNNDADIYCSNQGYDSMCQISYISSPGCQAGGAGMCTSTQTMWDGSATFKCNTCVEICTDP